MPTLLTENGYKIAYADADADNSQGNAAADLQVSVAFDELENVLGVLAVTVQNGSLKSVDEVSGNTVTVTVHVDAGQVAHVRVLAYGY